MRQSLYVLVGLLCFIVPLFWPTVPSAVQASDPADIASRRHVLSETTALESVGHIAGAALAVTEKDGTLFLLLPDQLQVLAPGDTDVVQHTIDFAVPVGLMVREGDRLYIASTQNLNLPRDLHPTMLYIVDITVPGKAHLLGKMELADEPLDIVARGSYLYLLSWQMTIVDVSDGSNPRLLESDSSLGGQSAQLYNEYLYVGSSYSITIYNLATPANPTVVAEVGLPGYVQSMLVVDDLLFATSRVCYPPPMGCPILQGIDIVDVSDPPTPTFLGEYEISGIYQLLTKLGPMLYLSQETSDGQIAIFEGVDLSDPSQPSMAYRYEQYPAVNDALLQGSRLYLAGPQGLREVDLSSTVNPVLTPRVTAYRVGLDYYSDAIISGTLLFGTGDKVLSVSDLSDPAWTNQIATDTGPHLSGEKNIERLGHRTIVLNTMERTCSGPYPCFSSTVHLQQFDISHPGAPSQVGAPLLLYDHFGWGFDRIGMLQSAVNEAETRLYVADSRNVRVMDVTLPMTPTIIGTYTHTVSVGSASGLEVKGDTLFLGMTAAGVQVLDARDPAQITMTTGHYSATVYALALEGNLLFVGAEDGLHVVEASNPTTLTRLARYPTDRPVTTVQVDGSYAYLGRDDGAIEVVDVSNPGAPAWAGWPGHRYQARVLAAEEGNVYVAGRGGGLTLMRRVPRRVIFVPVAGGS